MTVDATFGLEAIHEAQAAFEAKAHVGALVIDLTARPIADG